MTRAERWTTMSVIALAGTFIYLLPFLREIYYLPLKSALGVTDTELGWLLGATGLASVLTYVPGGWLADRYSPRLLVSVSLVATGLLGFVFASFPSFNVALVIQFAWGMTSAGAFWGAMIRATREWAGPDAQGRAFGTLEAGRGASEAAIYSIFLAVFAWLGSTSSALSTVILIYSAMNVGLGVVAWFTLSPGKPALAAGETAPGIADFLRVARLPQVWLIAVVVLAGYSAYWGSFNFTPYVTEVFGMGVVAGGAVGAGKVWLKPVAALIAGVIADRVGVSRAVVWSFVALVLSFTGFALMPGTDAFVPLMLANVVLASFFIFVLRGIYFALLEEGGVPLAVTGTAAGFISLIGYTPDIFMPVIGGAILDRWPGGTGFKIFYALTAAIAAAGLIAALAIRARSTRRRDLPSATMEFVP